jgi:hypothetical protein
MNELELLFFAAICIPAWFVLLESEKMIDEQKRTKRGQDK